MAEFNIPATIDKLFKLENIRTRKELDMWCGGGKGQTRKKLYNYVKEFSPEHWARMVDPRARVRGHYETRLEGYKIHK
jgi:hypothetical protein